MDAPLADGNWPLIAASDVAWTATNQRPRPMTRADMDAVRDQFVAATRMAVDAGFDMIELHAAHGYLLSSFITPLMNKRTDDYGGSLENRLRYPLEVFAAMRDAWPAERPMAVRISANDWAGDEGVTPAEAVEIARAFVASRRRPDRRVGGADLGGGEAGLWPHVPDAVRRPHPQRGSARDDGGGQYLRGRPRQFDPRRGPRRSGRARRARIWSIRCGRSGKPPRRAMTARSCPPPYRAGQEQLTRILARKVDGQ